MKRLLILAVLLLTVQIIFAQGSIAKEVKLTWGSDYEIPKGFNVKAYYFNPEEGFMLVSSKRMKDLSFQRFDKDKLGINDEKEVNIENLAPSISFDGAAQFNNRNYLYFKYWDDNKGKEILFAQEVDISKNGLKATKKVLIEANEYSGTDYNNFIRNYSFDDSKMLITYKSAPEVRNNSENKDIIHFTVFDSELNKLWNNTVRMPYTEELMDIADYEVDSRGNAYLLAKVYHEKRDEVRDGRPNYHFELMKLKKSSNSLETYSFETKKFVDDLTLVEYAPGKLLCAGYYDNLQVLGPHKTERSSGTSGAVSVKFNENSQPKISLNEFPLEILKEFEKGKEQKKIEKKYEKDEAGLSFLSVNYVNASTDGSLVISGEVSFYSVEVRQANAGQQIKTYTYSRDNILVMKIDADGKMAWVNKIPKQQKGVNKKSCLSFESFKIKGDYYYFYADNDKNYRLNADDVPKEYKDSRGGHLAMVKIDGETGKMEKDYLLDLKEYKIDIYPSRIDKVSENMLICRPISRGAQKIFKMEF